MEIKRFGKNSIQIKGKKEVVWLDPEDKMLFDTKIGGRIGVYTDDKQVSLGQNNVVLIAGPGEYEVGGVEVLGINAGDRRAIYTIMIDGVMVGLLGELKEDLNDKKVERVAAVDVLIAPINNGSGLGGKRLLDLGKKWGANMLIPVGFESQDSDIKKFLNETDFEGQEEVESIKVDKDLLPDGMEVVVLKSN